MTGKILSQWNLWDHYATVMWVSLRIFIILSAGACCRHLNGEMSHVMATDRFVYFIVCDLVLSETPTRLSRFSCRVFLSLLNEFLIERRELSDYHSCFIFRRSRAPISA
jgi:hypothetical protein